MGGQPDDRKEERTGNTGLAKVAVQCSTDIFVVNQTLVLSIKICGKNGHLCRNRYMTFMRQTQKMILILTLLFSINTYGRCDSIDKVKKELSTENFVRHKDTIYVQQLTTNNTSTSNFDLKIWLPTLTALLVLLISNLVTLYKIRKDTSEAIKKDIVTAKIRIERERLEKFYDPIYTTLKSNSSLFNAYGPSTFPQDGGVLETEAAQVWRQLVENVIIPNNQKIENVIQQFSHLKDEDDNLEVYLEYLVHLESYRHFILNPNTLHKAFKYPSKFIDNVEQYRNRIITRLKETENKLT